MKVMGAIAAAWIYLVGVAFFIARFVLYVRLTCARVGVRLMWSGSPGYLERRYADAPEAVRVRLRTTFRIHELLKRTLLWSLAAGVLAIVAALVLQGLRGGG
jgi:hypothetical protein